MAQEREISLQPQLGTAEETLERLVAMTTQTNLVALDKTLAAIRRAQDNYSTAAARVGSIAERISRAALEVGATLPTARIYSPQALSRLKQSSFKPTKTQRLWQRFKSFLFARATLLAAR